MRSLGYNAPLQLDVLFTSHHLRFSSPNVLSELLSGFGNHRVAVSFGDNLLSDGIMQWFVVWWRLLDLFSAHYKL